MSSRITKAEDGRLGWLRVYAWVGLPNNRGIINNALATVIIVLVTIGVIMAALILRKKDQASGADNA